MVPETLRIHKQGSTSFCLYASAWKLFYVSNNTVLSWLK